MKKVLLSLLALCCFLGFSPSGFAQYTGGQEVADFVGTDVVLEPWTYRSDFSDRTLGAWASYPFWQDIAYNPQFRTNEIFPGDADVAIVQKVTPYTLVDNYAGAQKRLDMYLVPDSEVSFRFFLKTNQYVENIKVRFAAGEYGKIDVTLPAPATNQWVWTTVNYQDFIRENPELAGLDKVKIYALAFLAKIPTADPDMPIYLGLNDIVFKGARAVEFQFEEPAVHKLPEFKPYIPERHYYRGDTFRLSGQWPLDARTVTVRISPYTHPDQVVHEGQLRKRGENWVLDPLRLNFPEGLYLGTLVARDGSRELSASQFTIHIAPRDIAGNHPRLLFTEGEKAQLKSRFREERFRGVYEGILEDAKRARENIPVESLVYDLDQFPDEDWLPTWSAWGSRIYHTGNALRLNARAYAFHDDREAGRYVVDVLVRLSEWPDWTHPWQTKRGRFSEHRTGSWSHRVAEAYDLTYDLMTPEEGAKIRKAVMENIVGGAHRTYVYNDNVTAATSNWLAMVLGGSLMNMAAMFGDGPETENLEPYFTGAMIKFYRFLNRTTDSVDGGWGEGFGYINYSFSNMSYSVPSLKNVFNIDVTEPLENVHNEFIWGGIFKQRRWFEYGDSGSNLGNPQNWLFLLKMRENPRLSWYYNQLKDRETYESVVFNTDHVPMASAFEENPVKVFRGVGTTVFKSGWEPDDMIFNMRTGPFYNHQHHEQGTFWFADRGEVFILGSRPLSNTNYYDDPLYQPWYTQAVGSSTVLIDWNHQSQRIGDDLHYAPGFHDHAFIDHFLDGAEAAFSTGDIGRLYWDKVKSLRRNVLYLKPNTILMLDTVVPANGERDVTLLYQTERLEDIRAGQDVSTITRGNATLNILHLAPDHVESKAMVHPHYLHTLRRVHPLERSGMLTITARTRHTDGHPLVMANLFKATGGEDPDVRTEKGEGYVRGVVEGKNFAFTTRPGRKYQTDHILTDALAVTWSDRTTFVAEATDYREDGVLVIESDVPVTFERSGNRIRYYIGENGTLTVGVQARPSSVQLNGTVVRNFNYRSEKRAVVLNVPSGEGEIIID